MGGSIKGFAPVVSLGRGLKPADRLITANSTQGRGEQFGCLKQSVISVSHCADRS